MTSPPSPARPLRVLISCGEASGDLYAAALTRALRRRRPTVQVSGFGGQQLAEAGASLIADYKGLSVTGLVEAVAVLPRSWKTLRAIEASAAAERPDVFVAVDFPDFNFRLLPIMHRLGVPIVYYISPQLWAWRPSRLETIKRYVRQMLVIFPFEQRIYADANVPVEFVGHPLVELITTGDAPDAWRRRHELSPGAPLIAMLPGSRPNEVTRMLPVIADAARLIRTRLRDAEFVVARAPFLDDDLFAPVLNLQQSGVPVRVVEGEVDDVLEAADVAVTASGTATVQTALHRTPMVIVYRLAPLTHTIAKAFVRLKTFGMVNLVAGRTIVPELIQDACTAEGIAREVIPLLTDADRRETMRADLDAVRAALGGAGASDKAAAAVLRIAAGKSSSFDYTE